MVHDNIAHILITHLAASQEVGSCTYMFDLYLHKPGHVSLSIGSKRNNTITSAASMATISTKMMVHGILHV